MVMTCYDMVYGTEKHLITVLNGYGLWYLIKLMTLTLVILWLMGIISQFITAWVGCFWDFTSQNMTMTWGELWVQATKFDNPKCVSVLKQEHMSHMRFSRHQY